MDDKTLAKLMEATKNLPNWRFALLAGIGWLFGLAALSAALPWGKAFAVINKPRWCLKQTPAILKRI